MAKSSGVLSAQEGGSYGLYPPPIVFLAYRKSLISYFWGRKSILNDYRIRTSVFIVM